MDTAPTLLGRREQRKLEIRARIEDAAYKLFREQGIEETSIEQICVEADVARRTFYGHYSNKHALLGGLGISRLYNQSEPMLNLLMANHHSTRARLEAMIEYIASNFATFSEIDRQLILIAPSIFAENAEQQREIGNSASTSFARLITAGIEIGDVRTDFSPDILSAMIVGTLNMLTTSWAMNSEYPVFANLAEARNMFEQLICKPGS
ncbi:MAG: TetR/AcrR family transcriptional regulator [Gammaproteobacteria bacterium]|jgi:AcrR family transcriptional regulator|nr:TetR/AcrR family transcriptional regulator [Gammaproteobacteria bacterium]MDH5173053.1 TetR/AcrR family transcriptional regulator [Gammaproteobacteria bacterium]